MSDIDQQAVLTLTIQDKSVLDCACMSFLRNSGLFEPATRPHRLGDEVFLLLTLMEEPEKLPVADRVVWITPEGAQGRRVSVSSSQTKMSRSTPELKTI